MATNGKRKPKPRRVDRVAVVRAEIAEIERRIDERLDRLTERHEGLAQSQELTHHDILALQTTARELAIAAARDAEAINALARIAEAHEKRIDDLEGGGER